MALFRSSSEKARSAFKYITGFFLLVGGFVAIVFTSPPRTFNVSIGDNSSVPGVAYADVPYSEASYYAEGSYGCGGGEGSGEGCGEGCGEGK